MKKILKKILLKIPYVAYLHDIKGKYFKGFEPGHFYSPIVNHDDILEFEDQLFNDRVLYGININEDFQKRILDEMIELYHEIPFTSEKSENLNYYFNNETFSYSDGIFLHLMIRKFKPKNIIEIGCGFSSAVMVDTNNLFFNGAINIMHIDPYPFHLNQAFGSKIPESNFLKEKIQNTSSDRFQHLKENDILFIDSSHVSKCGSDLNHIIFNILPKLNQGTLVHFHDIFYPFEYPKKWVLDKGFHKNGFGWNEIYLLRSFLMYNNQFEIILWPNYLIETNKSWFEDNMPLCINNPGGSIWIRKK
jgi:predicted O-methyltransferase YrrM